MRTRVALMATVVVGISACGTTEASLAGPAHVPSTSITISGARPGPVFDGVGAIAGGGGTARLLIDYPEPERSQILDYLFKPGYGADVQVLKMEIGGDAEATDAAEPSFEHTRGHISCKAGYEIWLAQQARQRNPHIKLYALQWNAPGWVGNGIENPWTKTDYGYLLSWLKCAKKAGLTISYLGGWNEHLPHGRVTPAIMRWFVGERAMLNAHGYRDIKIVGVDSARRDPDVSDLLKGNPAFARAIGVLGYHDICEYPTTGRVCQVPSAAIKSGKPIWATEIGSLRPPGNGGDFARTINNAFIQARATAIIEYPLVAAMPGGIPEEDRGLVEASQPWSGSYQVSLNSWVTAQTTQVTEPGWRHVAGASGQLAGHGDGSYVAYMGPSRKAWSLVAQTSNAAGPQSITVHVKGGLPTTTVHAWATRLNPADPAGWFVRQPDIRLTRGSFTTTLQPGYVYSFTTTTGQGHCGFGGIGAVPASACPAVQPATPMPAYATTPSGTTWPQSAYGPDQSLEPWGLEPADGSFEYPSKASPYFVQSTAGRPDFWQPMRKLARFPYAVFGDYCLGDVPVAPIPPNNSVPSWCVSPAANYTVSATVRFTKAGQSAGVIARYYRPVTTPIQYFQGYRFVVSESGQWQLLRDSLSMTAPAVLAKGSAAALGTVATHVLSLNVNANVLTASIDGSQVVTMPDPDGAYLTGVAGICTGGWYPVDFYNVTVGS
jgi:O-glycosyl hydrolase